MQLLLKHSGFLWYLTIDTAYLTLPLAFSFSRAVICLMVLSHWHLSQCLTPSRYQIEISWANEWYSTLNLISPIFSDDMLHWKALLRCLFCPLDHKGRVSYSVLVPLNVAWPGTWRLLDNCLLNWCLLGKSPESSMSKSIIIWSIVFFISEFAYRLWSQITYGSVQ